MRKWRASRKNKMKKRTRRVKRARAVGASHSISMLRSSRKAVKVPSWYRRKQLCRDQCRTSPSLSQSPKTPGEAQRETLVREELPLSPWSTWDHPGKELHCNDQTQQKASPKPPCQSPAADTHPHPHLGNVVLTLCQVQDGSCHLEPLVPVDHLQPIQQAHDIGLLLSPIQLQPPPALHWERDTTTRGAPLGVPLHPSPRAEPRAGTLSMEILLEASPVAAELGLLGVAVQLWWREGSAGTWRSFTRLLIAKFLVRP